MRPQSVALAATVYLLLWAPAVLASAFISFIAGYVGSGFAPLWIAIPSLLFLPAVLLGIISFRASAITIAAFLLPYIVATTWPHITLHGFLDSTLNEFLALTTLLVALTAIISPFPSIMSFFRHVRDC